MKIKKQDSVIEKLKLKQIESKILLLEAIKRQVAIWRYQEKKIVFTNGCFDILHLGHIDYLAKAFGLGDVLIVGLNSDESVRKIKGTNRPVNDQNSRAMILASLSFVNAVIVFDEDTPYNLIQSVLPDVLVKGGDYNPKDIAGSDVVIANGGTVKTLAFLAGYSTTGIIKKLQGDKH